MLAVGYFAGTLLGWNHMDSLFLGGMLSMSSTTIIIKAFDDLKLRAQRFTEIVFGVLIIEDIAGIVMMVLLATMAVASADVSTMELLLSIGRLIFFLVLWFVLGMYLVPSFFKWAKQLMNEETGFHRPVSRYGCVGNSARLLLRFGCLHHGLFDCRST